MVRQLSLLAAVSLAFQAGAAEPPPRAARFYCNLHAFTPAERDAHTQLSLALLKAVLETRELDNGFAMRMDDRQAPLVTLAKWVDGERRCCPFLRFEIVQEPPTERAGGPLWLRLTGAPGVKDFLRAELGIGAKK